MAEEIQSVQMVSSEVAKPLGLIGGSVATLLQFVSAAAGAASEQSSVTREISSNMQAAARDVAGINTNLSEGGELAA